MAYIENTPQSRLEHTSSLEVEEFTLKLTYHDKEFVLPRVVKWITLICDWEKCEGTETLLVDKAFYWWTYISRRTNILQFTSGNAWGQNSIWAPISTLQVGAM